MLVRLNKILARAGVASRRAADRMIEEGRVKVNGRVIRDLGEKADDAADRVEVDGRPVGGGEAPVYILLNKPEGVVTTLADERGRRTVRDLLPARGPRVFPVGRLDADSTGLLLLTNDGDLAYRLTHPRYEVPKVYVAGIEGRVGDDDLEPLRAGVFVDGKRTAPAGARVLRHAGPRTVVRVEIHEGRKREVRRMFEAIGMAVASLERTDFAGLSLRGLKRGEWRYLTSAEVRKLRSEAGLGGGAAARKR